MRWMRFNEDPPWEGLIIPGLARDDPRLTQEIAEPASGLRPFVTSYWRMTWNVPAGTPLGAIVVPIPCVNIVVFQARESPGAIPEPRVEGPKTKGSAFPLQGRGMSFGVQFHPWGFYPLVRRPLSELRDQGAVVKAWFPDFPRGDVDGDLAARWPAIMDEFLGRWLDRCVPGDGAHAGLVAEAFRRLGTDEERSMTVAGLAAVLGAAPRSLQRVFEQQVGLSVSAARRIVRLQKALGDVARTRAHDLATLALDHGFFDQPHFFNEFRKLLGLSPRRFRQFW